MKNILAEANRMVLEQFAWSNVVLAFDYDGTLAPIVSRPERAVMRESTRRLLEQLAAAYPCIVISGRSQADVARRLRSTGVHEVIGNHGIEPWKANQRLSAEVQRWRPILEAHLAPLRGVQIEDKLYSLAIHYRQSREKRRAVAAIVRAIEDLGDVRVIGGKQVVNVLPASAPHKGSSLIRERTRLGCDTAIYIGDDETDEDVFTLDQPGQLLSVRVGRRSTSAAAYFVRSQDEMDALMQVLVELRRDAALARTPWRGR
jgi:trehalose 6-phosphate phosphatase